jgi:hypothetical protein
MLLLASEAATYIFLILSLNKMMINVEHGYSNQGLMTGTCILSVKGKHVSQKLTGSSEKVTTSEN